MYSIQQLIPSSLTITVKENIESLTGTVISSQYYLSINDYKELCNATNGIIDTLNLINSYSYIVNFSTNSTLEDSISSLIENNFVCIKEANDKSVSGNLDILTQFKINGYIHQYDDINEGNIDVKGKFISGNLSSFVTSFNGRIGNISGINGVIINGELLSTNNGLVLIDGLIAKDSYIKSINNDNSEFDKKKILSTATIQNNIFTTNSDGNIEITGYLTGKTTTSALIMLELLLANVDLSNLYSAVNRSYLNSHNTDLVLTGFELPSGWTKFTIPSHYYPLHFYDLSGNLCNIKWTISNNQYTVPSADNKLFFSIIKVDLNV